MQQPNKLNRGGQHERAQATKRVAIRRQLFAMGYPHVTAHLGLSMLRAIRKRALRDIAENGIILA